MGQIKGGTLIYLLDSNITTNVCDPFSKLLQATDTSTSRAFALSVSYFDV